MTTTDIVLELERLRSAMELGFAKVETRFAEVDGKLTRLCERAEETDADLTAMEVRLSALEKRVYVASGAAALLGMGIPFLVQLLER